MKYGKYDICLSIGYSGADREDELNLADYYTLEQWDAMTEDEQADILSDLTFDLLSRYSEYTYTPQ